MANIGRIEPYDGSSDLEAYLERLEMYLVANDVAAVGIAGADEVVQLAAEKKKVATLLTLVGPETYLLLKSLVSPQRPIDLSFDEITARLKSHLTPRRLIVAERFKFHQRTQKDGEAIATFAAELRRLASTCNFGEFLSEALRDQLVCGIRSSSTQRKLLSEERSFEQAMQMALADEVADSEAKQIAPKHDSTSNTVPVDVVHKYQSRVEKKFPEHQRNDNAVNATRKRCYRCNGNHTQQQCRFKDATCHFCQKRGHIAEACRKKNGETHLVSTTHETDERDEYSDYSLYHVTSGPTSHQPIEVGVQMDGKSVKMLVDTGAGVSIINETTYRELWSHPPKLQSTDVNLTSYTGQSVPVLGQIDVVTQYKQQSAHVPIIVVSGTRKNLLGRNLLSQLKLDWGEIMHVCKRDPVQSGLLAEVPGVFSEGLGKLKDVQVKIHVKNGAIPRFFKARPIPYALKEKVENELDRLQHEGIIEPVQFSEWAAPIVPVCKANGQIRICGDYKVTINRSVVEDKYPLPRVNDLYASLAGGETFSKLDLRHAYLQLPLDEGSREYVTINTHKGLFRYTRLPYGISVAPSIFQRALECVLADIPRVCIFLDDILVTGKTREEHVANLRWVLRRLDEAGLKLNNDKCEFFNQSVVYLGHKIDRDGLHPTDDKVRAIRDAPSPTNVKELRSWLGLLNYYGRFLRNLSTTLAPLHVLLRKETKWCWGNEQASAFEAAKQLLQSDSLLVHFDPDKPLLLACDASPYGVGAVLSHQMEDGSERPIAFASRSLSPAEINYSQLDKEGLSLVFGVTKFHQYLYGMKFVLITDHRPLIGLFNEQRPIPPQASGRLQRWALTLAGYAYIIRHRSGDAHGNCDALSRLPLHTPHSAKTPAPAEYVQLIENLNDSPVTSTHIRTWTQRDPVLSRVHRYLLTGWPESDITTTQYHKVRDELSIHDGCVMRGARIIVPEPGRATMLKLLHSSHSGVVKMKALARSYIWWPGIDLQMEQLSQQCAQCEENARQPTRAPLRPWLFPQEPWKRVHLDYAGPIENRMILVAVDAYSKWISAMVVRSSTSEVTIEQLRMLFAEHGLPETIVTDNGTCFTSAEFTQFMRQNGIQHITSPAYHPSSNGLAERAVQLVKRGLTKMTDGSMQTRLARYLLTYRVTPHGTTGSSPSMLLKGRQLRTLLDVVHPNIGAKVHKSQEKMTEYYNQKSKKRHFSPGDAVYVKNHTQSSPKWIPAVLRELHNDVLTSQALDGRQLRRHRNHVRLRHAGATDYPVEADIAAPAPAPIQQAPEYGESGNDTIDESDDAAPIPGGSSVNSPAPQPAVRRSERERKAPERLSL